MIYHWKALICSTFRICKKNFKFAKLYFFGKFQFYSKKVSKNVVKKNDKNTLLKSPYPCDFKYANIFAKFE